MIPRRHRDTLTLVAWNACGLKNKLAELTVFMRDHDIDMALISETWLRPSDRIVVHNYCVYRTDRRAAIGGGTLILIRSTIEHSPSDLQLGSLEATVVSIPTREAGTLRVVSAYQSPSRQFLVADYQAVFSGNDPVLMAGDLNAKRTDWGCRVNNGFGTKLASVIDAENLKIVAPSQPTYFGTGGRPDILDVALTRNVAVDVRVEVVDDLSSDHNPLMIRVGGDVLRMETGVEMTSWRDFESIVAESCSASAMSVATEGELDRAAEWLNGTLADAVGRATTRRPFTPSGWLPPHTRALLAEKRRARKIARRTGDPVHKHRANVLSNKLRDELRQFESEQWDNRLRGLSTRDGSLWKLTKEVQKGSRATVKKPVHGLGGLVYTDEAKAEAFADYLEDVFSVGASETDSDTDSDADGEEEDLRGTEAAVNDVVADLRGRRGEPIAPATLAELRALIQALDNNRAPGYDKITNRAMKHLPDVAVRRLLEVINASLRLFSFPTVWKRAVVVMIPKPNKDHLFPQNHRPISLLPILGKLLEAVVLSRLREEIEDNGLIPDAQFGFRAAHSTDQQLFRLTESVREGFERRESTAAIFLDLEKAFDTVWHDGIIYKIIRSGININLAKMLKTYLENRVFQVRVGAHVSTLRPIAAGVPQGSLLGPELFLIYVSDVPETAGTQMAQYADDTAIYASCRDEDMLTRRMQEAVDAVCGWLARWRLRVNAGKCQAIRFTRRRLPQMRRIEILGEPVAWSDTARYLGVTLDRGLTFRDHFQDIKQKVAAARQTLNPLLCSGSRLSLDNKRLLYRSMIRPVISYGALSWVTAAKTHFRRLEVVQSRVLRYMTGAPWFMSNNQLRRDLDIETIEEFVIATAREAYKRAEASSNPLLRQIFEKSPHHNPRRRVRRAGDALSAAS